MKRRILTQVAIAVCISLYSTLASAQGIVVTKTDGTKLYFKAEEVKSVGVYGYGEEPKPEGGTYKVKGVSFEMVAVEGGTFQMGGEDPNDDPDEQPVHEVTLNSFVIGQTEVTQELWEAVMGFNPSSMRGQKLPVENVSWYDCQAFITKLNQLTGQEFRLPTEAEWEFAARGGNLSKEYTYSGSNNVDEVAWYTANNDSITHDVGTKAPNELGIYDMSGNVWEWCQDLYDSEYYANSPADNPTGPNRGLFRVGRGGGYLSTSKGCRVIDRGDPDPGRGYSFYGFRLAL